MVATFTIDKILATLLGRPPLVSWRYCDIQYPLDLSFEEMLLEPSLVQKKILSLERNGGWNDEGTIRKGAWARVSLFKSILREKVLELSLSYRVEDIRSKAEWVFFFFISPSPTPLRLLLSGRPENRFSTLWLISDKGSSRRESEASHVSSKLLSMELGRGFRFDSSHSGRQNSIFSPP